MCRLRELLRTCRSVCGAILCAVVLTAPTYAEPLPYKARVVVPAAPILSGPSDEFYPTDTLPEGTMVEVHRENGDGWCAIRPPEHSFSWVYACHLEKLDRSLAEINKDDVASRIGSRLSEKRNAVQVRLKRGEVVQLIGGETVAGRTWYKVAPPAGEFRWIHKSSIRRTEPTATSRAIGNEIVTVAAAIDASEAGAVNRAAAQLPVTESASEDWRAASDPATAQHNTTTDGDSSEGSVPVPQSQDASASQPDATEATPGTRPGAPPRTPAPLSSDSEATETTVKPSAEGDMDRSLGEIELRLSRTVTGAPTTWNIEVLEREAEQLLAQAQSHTDRENIKITLAKLDRFASIQRRYARLSTNSRSNTITPIESNGLATPPGVHRQLGPQSGLIPLVSNRSPQSAPGVASSGAYDAVGILRPVVSKRPGAPQFALVDERGQVLSFVTATPDINLQPYIGHRVGVAGNRGFIPEFQRAHVTAGRVVPLAEGMHR